MGYFPSPSPGGEGANYSKYVALLTQTGTNNPTAAVQENTLGETPVLTRDAQGEYFLDVSGNLFTSGKTVILSGAGLSGPGNQVLAIWQSPTQVFIATYTGGASADGMLFNTAIEIRVYP